jgi:hypothetical protein
MKIFTSTLVVADATENIAFYIYVISMITATVISQNM